ncbi:MAG: hypothetical protein K6U88_16680, partial [Dehalococcoidia bacterium]|nr:hypothetical protein [Dehalococcoidia bacterium]
MGLALALAGVFGTVPVAAALPGRWWRGAALALAPAAVFVYLLTLLERAKDGDPLTWSIEWVPALGIALAFRADGLALLFGLLIAGIGALVLVYAEAYMAGKAGAGRLEATLLAFMGAMLGVVFADDVVTLFVAWELTSITSFLLISFEQEKLKARKAAVQALLVTGAGGLALLAGLVALGQAAGTYRISEMRPEAVAASSLATGAMVLVLLGAFTKSAQVPFHFWLPIVYTGAVPAVAGRPRKDRPGHPAGARLLDLGGHVAGRERRRLAEEELLHVASHELLRLLLPGQQPILVEDHLHPLFPERPRLGRDVVVDPLPELAGPGSFRQPGHEAAELHALDHPATRLLAGRDPVVVRRSHEGIVARGRAPADRIGRARRGGEAASGSWRVIRRGRVAMRPLQSRAAPFWRPGRRPRRRPFSPNRSQP